MAAKKKKQYRTVSGVVQWPPREGEAGEQTVRNITVRTTGLRAADSHKVGATLWPSHDHIEVDEGDFVVMEGAFTQNVGEKDGEEVTYNNLSVSSILVLGSLDPGVRDDDDDEEDEPRPRTRKKSTTKSKPAAKKTAAQADDEDDDDIPF